MTNKIEISRELANLLYGDTVERWGLGGNAAGQLRALLAAPAVERQGPVAQMPPMADRRPYDDEDPEGYLEGDDDWSSNNPGAVAWLADNHAAIRLALCAEQPAPVSVVLPERGKAKGHYANGWNACLDKVKELNQ